MISSSLIRNFVAPLWAWHEDSSFLRQYKNLKKDEQISDAEREDRQWERLKTLIGHAWNHCPYYRRRFSSVGFEPADLRVWDDYLRLPILTKKEISENSSEMISTQADRAYFVPRKTSGSTGVSLNFFTDDREFQFKRAVTLYRDEWTGWRLGEWKALVWGNPSYMYHWRGRLRNILLERMFSLDTLKMDERMIRLFAEEIFRRRPTLLFGHAHSLFLFAKYWADNGLAPYKFKGIISTAMVLHSHERQKCESVFGSPVFDRYGCEEVSLIASECEAHSGLHINSDSLVVEILGDHDAVARGEPGQVVLTDLFNFAMPFIRYEVGDMASKAAGVCPCGRSYPLLGRINGRIADYLKTPEGHWISGISLTENFATLISGIHQIQIIQDANDHLLLRVVKNSAFDENSQSKVDSLVVERFGPKMRFSMEFVPQIRPEPSGKYRFTIYRVSADR